MSNYSTDTRPRVKYLLPDGRPLTVVCGHDELPKPMISFELRADDDLWNKAQRIAGSTRRIVWAQLAQGL